MTAILTDEKDQGKKSTVANLYRYSDLSIDAIAQQVDMDQDTVQQIVDNLQKEDALELVIGNSVTYVEKIMSPFVLSLDCSRTPREAAVIMAENEIGSVVVTKNGNPFGIVTHSDIVRWTGKWPMLLDSTLESVASVPLIASGPSVSVEEAANIMITNRIHKLPIIEREKLVGIVTITDLAVFLSPSRRPGLALSILHAISRGRKNVKIG